MISFNKWVLFFIQSQLALLFCGLKMHKLAYNLIENKFDKYYLSYKKDLREDFVIKNDEGVFSFIDEILLENSVKSTFGLGCAYANWAVCSKEFDNFAYIDDYELCDSFYRYIYSNKVENILTAVLYPLVYNDEIKQELNYRALYDAYAQKRFKSQACLVLEMDELLSNVCFDYEEFAENISRFGTDVLIIRLDNSSIDKEKIEKALLNKYENIKIVQKADITLLLAKTLVAKEGAIKEYNNDNRMALEAIHTEKILEILKKKSN